MAIERKLINGEWVITNPQASTNIEVVQSTGDSTTAVMSQKAVTDALGSGGNVDLTKINEAIDNANTAADNANAIKEELELSRDKGMFDGAPGTSVTVKSVSESTESGGSNVVTFSDGKTLTVKNGKDGASEVSIPSYWETAIANAIGKIKTLQNNAGANAFQFVWFSDVHGKKGYVNENGHGKSDQTHIGAVAQYTANKFNIPLIAASGDIMSQSSHFTEESVWTEYEDVWNILSPIDINKFLCIKGNHDGAWGTPVNGVYYLNNIGSKKIYNALYRKQATDRQRVFGDNGTYFYVDSPQKFRFIMLNSHTDGDGTNNADGSATYNPFKNFVFGKEQLQWLCDEALNVPKGWHVVIMSHAPFNDVKDGSLLSGIIKAYNNKAPYTGNYTINSAYWGDNVTDTTYKEISIESDFSSANGEIIAYFHGHSHRDRVYTLNDVICVGITTAGGDVRDADYTVERTPGTATETAMDIVTIDTDNKKIHCTRLGAGFDRVIPYGTENATYSITNNLTNCTSSNKTITVNEGASYSTVITCDSGYVLDSVTVTMGGIDVTSDCVSGRNINIYSVSGNIVITVIAVAESQEPDSGSTYINLFDASGSGFAQASATKFTTNWMPYNANDNDGTGTIYHIKGLKDNSGYTNPYKFHFAQDENGTFGDGTTGSALAYCTNANQKANVTADYDTTVKLFQHQYTGDANLCYIQFEIREAVPENLIITANEPIIDSGESNTPDVVLNTNVFDKTADGFLDNYRISSSAASTGYVTATSGTNQFMTNYIRIDKGMYLNVDVPGTGTTLSTTVGGYFLSYDEDKNLIGTHINTSGTISNNKFKQQINVDGVVYVRMSPHQNTQSGITVDNCNIVVTTE